MPSTFRVASFNCENLFSRAKVLNLANSQVAADALTKIDQLNKLLHKATYTAADKQKMVALYAEVETYVAMRENRGKVFNKAKTQVVAQGASDWDGELEFKRAKFSEVTRENTAKVIKAVKADVACLVEVEDRPALAAFNSELLDSRKFKFPMLIDGNDPRGIDVGVLSNFPILSLKTHIFDGSGNSRTFSRDCLRVEMELPNQKRLHLLCNHFKSKSGGDAASDPRRRRQAERVAEILQEYDLDQDLVIVAGDLNDTPDATSPLRPLLDVAGLHDVLELQFPHDAPARWTYHFQGVQQIDYLLVSKPLKSAFVQAGVERRGIHRLNVITQGQEAQFDTVTSAANAASDHGAVWAEFSL
ncbi:MAG: endonuclease/exonuclease/phosphatase family protein [Pirellulales bacterium]